MGWAGQQKCPFVLGRHLGLSGGGTEPAGMRGRRDRATGTGREEWEWSRRSGRRRGHADDARGSVMEWELCGMWGQAQQVGWI